MVHHHRGGGLGPDNTFRDRLRRSRRHTAVRSAIFIVAGRDATTAGQHATAVRAEDPPSKEGWWARLRKRGLVVALATIVGAIAAVVGTAVAICVWVGWTP